ncbi:MAG: putative Ig domain-containing protein [Steroidobacteraceae bacterium]
MDQERILRKFVVRATAAIALLFVIAAAPPHAQAGPGDCRGNGRRACTTPIANEAPTIGGIPSSRATIGEPYAFLPTASDPEGKTLSFSIANRPPWAAFSASTGRLSGTPDASAQGLHVDIQIQVSDGKLKAALAPFSIEVRPANEAPSIAGAPPAAAREGQAYEFTPQAADPNGDALTFTIANRPPWASFSPQSGRLAGTPGIGSVGTYRDIVIRVSDGKLVATLPAFSVTVEQASLGRATISWAAPTLREDGSPLTNLAGFRIRYGTSEGSYPNQVQIANPGITTFVVENLPAGTYYFVATAYDSEGRESAHSAVASKTIG